MFCGRLFELRDSSMDKDVKHVSVDGDTRVSADGDTGVYVGGDTRVYVGGDTSIKLYRISKTIALFASWICLVRSVELFLMIKLILREVLIKYVIF